MSINFVCPPEFTALANLLADVAQPIARHYYRNDALQIITKEDNSPVTLADREIEEKWRGIIHSQRPGDAMWGEEFGRENIGAEWTWIFDPIDGTKSFTVGRPTFGCLIGLHHIEHGFVMGVVDQPITNLRWAAAKNQGATLNGKALRTKQTSLGDVRIAMTNPMRQSAPLKKLHQELMDQIGFFTYGGEVMNYVGIADGSVHANFDSRQKIYDIAATIPIIEEAGGVITSLQGKPIAFEEDQAILAACTPELHNTLMQRYFEIEKDERQ